MEKLFTHVEIMWFHFFLKNLCSFVRLSHIPLKKIFFEKNHDYDALDIFQKDILIPYGNFSLVIMFFLNEHPFFNVKDDQSIVFDKEIYKPV